MSRPRFRQHPRIRLDGTITSPFPSVTRVTVSGRSSQITLTAIKETKMYGGKTRHNLPVLKADGFPLISPDKIKVRRLRN